MPALYLMTTPQLILALAVPALQSCLLVVLLRRGLHRQFRFFFVYTAYAVITELIRIASSSLDSYFYIYWSTEGLYSVLAFLAIYEAFHSVFRNFYGIMGFRFLFPAVALAMIFIAVLRSRLLDASEMDRFVAIIVSLKIAVGFLQVGVFALFFLLVRFLKMRWRQYAFGIVLGFGISASTSLVGFLLLSEFGKKTTNCLQVVFPVAYCVAVVVWLVSFVRPQPAHPLQDWGQTLEPERLIAELRQYTKTVKGVLRQ
ncbi:MAG TPA: hypothetical protein VKZ53_01395 [Candidatus Angelobacter sp.]|nr:hypothetical protein [Candidatus Angelobacter sp.]